MIDINSLPDNLKPYIATQDYERYTPRDQASWRFIIRQSKEFFKQHAHNVYLEGLVKTGVPTTRIPRVDEMDQKLSQFGWGAICVKGFIPPAVFLEFQSRSLLPIATDMRTMEHIAYTPAPDIVHEAAGHAPIIADPLYASYLKKYAKLARKAIYSDQDVNLYEAIRALSDIKENPDSTKEAIAKSEEGLNKAVQAFTFTSESAKITRMYWWTAEYGIIKDQDQFKIYGAGLLSSVGESQDCLGDRVKKIPISLKCTEQAFNITEPQPQLFYAKNFQELIDLLDEMEQTMAFKIGGIFGLNEAEKAKATTTTELDSGLQISGQLESFEHEGDQVEFMKWVSPVQLAYQNTQLPKQGTAQHPHGFSTPLGTWKNLTGKHPQDCSLKDLEVMGLVEGKMATLEFDHGFKVQGMIDSFTFKDHKLQIISWSQCTASKSGTVYFDPDWGIFDMAVGTKVVSVFGGPADFAHYEASNFGNVTTTPARTSPFSKDELELFECYQTIRNIREQNNLDQKDQTLDQMQTIFNKVENNFSDEWLLYLEVKELLILIGETSHPMIKIIDDKLLNVKADDSTKHLIKKGINIAHIAD